MQPSKLSRFVPSEETIGKFMFVVIFVPLFIVAFLVIDQDFRTTCEMLTDIPLTVCDIQSIDSSFSAPIGSDGLTIWIDDTDWRVFFTDGTNFLYVPDYRPSTEGWHRVTKRYSLHNRQNPQVIDRTYQRSRVRYSSADAQKMPV